MKGISSPDQVLWSVFPIWDRASPKRPDVLELWFRDGEYLNPERTHMLSRSHWVRADGVGLVGGSTRGKVDRGLGDRHSNRRAHAVLMEDSPPAQPAQAHPIQQGSARRMRTGPACNLIVLSQVIKLTQRQNPTTQLFPGCDGVRRPASLCIACQPGRSPREHPNRLHQTTIADLIPETRMRRSRRRSRTTNQSTQV